MWTLPGFRLQFLAKLSFIFSKVNISLSSSHPYVMLREWQEINESRPGLDCVLWTKPRVKGAGHVEMVFWEIKPRFQEKTSTWHEGNWASSTLREESRWGWRGSRQEGMQYPGGERLSQMEGWQNREDSAGIDNSVTTVFPRWTGHLLW